MKWTVLAVAALLLVPAAALGAAVISVTVGGASTVVASPGQTLAFDITLSGVTVGVAGFDARLWDKTCSGQLEIIDRLWGRTFDPRRGDWPREANVNGWIGPWTGCKSKNLGCWAASVAEFPPDEYPSILMTLHVRIGDSWDRTPIVVNLTDPILSDANAGAIPVGSGPDLTILPEPATLLLLGFGGVCLRRRRG